MGPIPFKLKKPAPSAGKPMAMPGSGGAKTGLVKPLGGGSRSQMSSNGKIMGVLGKILV